MLEQYEFYLAYSCKNCLHLSNEKIMSNQQNYKFSKCKARKNYLSHHQLTFTEIFVDDEIFQVILYTYLRIFEKHKIVYDKFSI